MSRYIDIEPYEKDECMIVKKDSVKMNNRGWRLESTALESVKNIPTADVQPVMRGKWIKQEEPYVNTYECSNCNRWFTIEDEIPEENNYNYCPNCGADMRNDEKVKNQL